MKKSLTVPKRWLDNWLAHGFTEADALEHIAANNGIPAEALSEIQPCAHVVFAYTWGVDKPE